MIFDTIQLSKDMCSLLEIANGDMDRVDNAIMKALEVSDSIRVEEVAMVLLEENKPKLK